ncbi:dTDP-4-dehydrorhamnose 3,5-epimerase [Thermodesulfobacteriota bacterium]
MSFSESTLPGVIIIEPVVYKDKRGLFLETFHQGKYSGGGINDIFVQDNHSFSMKNTLRGLHYQLKNPQAKLIYAITGEIYDVAVDIRRGSPHFGKWMGVILSAENRKQIYVPKGFAHGFCVLSETADVIYKCSDFYSPGDEYGVLWSDPSIGIDWPVENPLLSEKDSRNPQLNDIPEKHLPA